MNKRLLFLLALIVLVGCGGSHFMIKNIDNTIKKPHYPKGYFNLEETATDANYAFSKEFPVNLGFDQERVNYKNVDLFFKALLGPNGEEISWEKIDTCCPYESKKSSTGAGTIDIYQITIKGTGKTYTLYINLFEKGKVMCPQGFTIRPWK